MGSRKDYPVKFTPKGLSDAWDATEAFPGACRTLENLIFDQSNTELMTARPGVGTANTSFGTFTTPTFVTVHIAIGDVIYGMVSTARTPGYDEPFAFNITAGTFTAISGIVAGNVPVSPSTTGAWVPPVMAVVGAKILVAHAGFSGGGTNFFGVIDISIPAAPTWTSTNTTVHALPSVPIAVANFNNRAYFACGNAAYYSDVLAPTVMTNAGQALFLGDTTDILALSGLPIQTTSSGVVAALIAFKQFQIWQITGDAAISGSLGQNYLSLTVGCDAPRSIVQTPIGTIFAGVDGASCVSALGQVLPLTKDQSKPIQDIQAPFQNVVTPSRSAAGFSGSIYRICMDTVIAGVPVTNDYWFDITVRRWCGPHTFNYDCVSQVGNYFVVSGRQNGAALFSSRYIATSTTVYTDNGVQLDVELFSSLFPKTPNINIKQVVESTIELVSQSASLIYSVGAYDEQFALISSANLTVSSSLPRWGSFVWGAGALWTVASTAPTTYTVSWSQPLVFKKMALKVTATSSSLLSIGTFFAKYRDCGYTNF